MENYLLNKVVSEKKSSIFGTKAFRALLIATLILGKAYVGYVQSNNSVYQNVMDKVTYYSSEFSDQKATMSENETIELLTILRNNYYDIYKKNFHDRIDPKGKNAEELYRDNRGALTDLVLAINYADKNIKNRSEKPGYSNYTKMLKNNIYSTLNTLKKSNKIKSSIDPIFTAERYDDASELFQTREKIMRFQEPLNDLARIRKITSIEERVSGYKRLLNDIQNTNFEAQLFEDNPKVKANKYGVGLKQEYSIIRNVGRTNITEIILTASEKEDLKNIILNNIRNELRKLQTISFQRYQPDAGRNTVITNNRGEVIITYDKVINSNIGIINEAVTDLSNLHQFEELVKSQIEEFRNDTVNYYEESQDIVRNKIKDILDIETNESKKYDTNNYINKKEFPDTAYNEYRHLMNYQRYLNNINYINGIKKENFDADSTANTKRTGILAGDVNTIDNFLNANLTYDQNTRKYTGIKPGAKTIDGKNNLTVENLKAYLLQDVYYYEKLWQVLKGKNVSYADIVNQIKKSEDDKKAKADYVQKIPAYNYKGRMQAWADNNLGDSKDANEYNEGWKNVEKNGRNILASFIDKFQIFNSKGDLIGGYDRNLASTSLGSIDKVNNLYNEYLQALQYVPNMYKKEFEQVFMNRIMILSYNTLKDRSAKTPGDFIGIIIHNQMLTNGFTVNGFNDYDKGIFAGMNKKDFSLTVSQKDFIASLKANKKDVQKGYGTFIFETTGADGTKYHITYCDTIYSNSSTIKERQVKIIVNSKNKYGRVDHTDESFDNTDNKTINKYLLDRGIGQTEVNNLSKYRDNDYLEFWGFSEGTYLSRSIIDYAKSLNRDSIGNGVIPVFKFDSDSYIFLENLLDIIAFETLDIYGYELHGLNNYISEYLKTGNEQTLRNGFENLSFPKRIRQSNEYRSIFENYDNFKQKINRLKKTVPSF